MQDIISSCWLNVLGQKRRLTSPETFVLHSYPMYMALNDLFPQSIHASRSIHHFNPENLAKVCVKLPKPQSQHEHRPARSLLSVPNLHPRKQHQWSIPEHDTPTGKWKYWCMPCVCPPRVSVTRLRNVVRCMMPCVVSLCRSTHQLDNYPII